LNSIHIFGVLSVSENLIEGYVMFITISKFIEIPDWALICESSISLTSFIWAERVSGMKAITKQLMITLAILRAGLMCLVVNLSSLFPVSSLILRKGRKRTSFPPRENT
jgi:hypothetical protein